MSKCSLLYTFSVFEVPQLPFTFGPLKNHRRLTRARPASSARSKPEQGQHRIVPFRVRVHQLGPEPKPDPIRAEASLETDSTKPASRGFSAYQCLICPPSYGPPLTISAFACRHPREPPPTSNSGAFLRPPEPL